MPAPAMPAPAMPAPAPTRLTRGPFFWQVHTAAATAVVAYGRGAGPGRSTTRVFDTPAAARAWAHNALAEKRAAGYVHPPPPTLSAPLSPAPYAPRRSARKRTAPESYALTPPRPKKPKPQLQPSTAPVNPSKSSKPQPEEAPSPHPRARTRARARARTRARARAPPKVKRGLAGTLPVDTSAPLGVIDPDSGLSGRIHTEDARGHTLVYDVMLALVDIANNHDKFIVLQLVDTGPEFVVYQRWGRTGTAGTSYTQAFAPDRLADAVAAFAEKFQEKTGRHWCPRPHPPVPGKYGVVLQDFAAKYAASVSDAPRWQYWVDDGVDGKQTNWYDYDETGNALAEQLYLEFQSNIWLNQRIVQSGMWAYLVNLESMTQTNVVHTNHTMRHIRRVPPGELPDSEPPTDDFIVPENGITAPVIAAMTVKKPNVLPSNIKPSHKVKAAPPAVVAEPPAAKTKKENKTEPSEEAPVQVKIPVDEQCPRAADYETVEDFDATLNQSNIMGGSNNNKYYKVQMVKDKVTGNFCVWMRWGRIGESRGTQTKMMGPFQEREKAEKVFCKKFRDKTGNDWSDRFSFVAHQGKYELLEMDHSAEKEEDATPLMMTLIPASNIEYHPSTLPKETRGLIELLFATDMYDDALRDFNIDARKMPLGSLSTAQIEKGAAVLDEIKNALSVGSRSAHLEELSSKFYTTLPHDFGRRRPPVINDTNMLQRCYDMCNVLLDMEKATNLMAEATEKTMDQKEKKKVPHPTEAQYASLNATLSLLKPGTEEHDVVLTAFERTKGGYGTSRLMHVWRVERKGEAQRFRKVKNLDNNMLLWHGSHIGAISAILSTGLRIMPHSGGRVGKGIYLASENGKSQDYTTPAVKSKIGCMFLAEAALGKTCEILDDDSSLTKPPSGYDSVRACGNQTPAGFKDITLDDVTVKVAVEEPRNNPKVSRSSFAQDEYLIYNEAQARIRYVITVAKDY